MELKTINDPPSAETSRRQTKSSKTLTIICEAPIESSDDDSPKIESPTDEWPAAVRRQRLAVDCRNVIFGYTKEVILNNVNVSVRRGHIYALLGASGCGKTTLLRNILGRLQPESGQIRVFGLQPNSRFSNIPGPGVGYMPQELALIGELSIVETLNFFGRLYHMDAKTINNRILMLVELLNLPDKHRRICEMSGGQQRRVSIAVTLFHKPPLLILDEPTVGIDPLLRDRIWKHLVELTTKEKITVMITTHYIEEAKSAHTVAMMRFGRILVQESPDRLMARHRCATLEDVFLKACQDDTGKIRRRLESIMPTDVKHRDAIEQLQRRRLSEGVDLSLQENVLSVTKIHKRFDFGRVSALLRKNVLAIAKSPSFMCIFLILPALQLLGTGLAFGRIPRNLPITLYNGEGTSDLAQEWINKLDLNAVVVQNTKSLDEAKEEVRKGKSWLAISIPENFSSAFEVRLTSPKDIDDIIIQDSTIKLYPDMSNSMIGITIYRSLIESYQKFATDFLIRERGFTEQTVKPPVKDYYIYGHNDATKGFEEFILPGFLALISFLMHMILAAFVMINDLQSGLTERSFVAGVRPTEVLFTHMTVLLVTLTVQSIILLLIAFFIIDMPCRGSVPDAFGLMMVQGFQGVSVGLLLGSILSDGLLVTIAVFGLGGSMMMASGVVWPLESMPYYMAYVAQAAPLTLPITAFRSVLLRGWSVFYWPVFLGYVVAAVYNLIAIGVALLVFRYTAFKVKK